MAGMMRYSLMAVGGLLILQLIIASVNAANDGAMDLCVLVDVSDSRLNPGTQGGTESMGKLKKFLIDLVSSLTLGEQETHVALSSFTSAAEIHHYLDGNQELISLRDSINTLYYTAQDRLIGKGLEHVQNTMFYYGNRSDAQDVVMLVTGGRTYSTGDWLVNAETEAEKLKDKGATIYVLAIGMPPEGKPQNEAELRAIASDPDHLYYILSADYGGLQNYASSLFSKSPEDPKTPVSTGEPMCADKLDLVFVLDDSSDIDEDTDWDTLLDYVVNVLKLFQVENDHVRVGMVMYSTVAYDAFKLLNSYQRNRTTLENEIRKLFHFGGQYRSVGAGIQSANEALFSHAQGDRPEARNVMVVVMAGSNNQDNDLIGEYAQQARARNIDIFTLGVSSKVNRTHVEETVSPPKEFVNYWIVPDFIALNSYVVALASAICEQGLEQGLEQDSATTTASSTGVQTTMCTGNKCGVKGGTGTASAIGPTLCTGLMIIVYMIFFHQ